MQCEILMIGTELLLGQIVDTNAAFMGQALAEYAIPLYQKTTVGDNPTRIRAALDAALTRSGVVLTSGGLGPTEDDITRECVADLLGRSLEFRPDLYEALAARFARFRFIMTENNKKQAYAPRGAAAIENPHGTAPGLIVEDARGTVVCMPGVPGELQPMLVERVIPYLRRKFGLTGVIHSRVLKVCGVGESRIDAAIADLIQTQRNPTVGVLACPDAVRIRITARAESIAEVDTLIDPVDAEIRTRLPGLVMGVDEVSIEEVVDDLLRARGWSMAIAETVTGGMLARRLTTAGAECLAGGIVVPLDRVREKASAAAARDLAEQARAWYGAVCALALLGDAEGQRTLVRFVAPDTEVEWELGYLGIDERSQVRASIAALEYLRRHLLSISA
jgi:nicotinamide-nucleotide amidase